ncbi:MAG: thermonuclease family protein [Ramlibacter sp.]|nr:thermonuclease family protein [Ramlibacter sp.]
MRACLRLLLAYSLTGLALPAHAGSFEGVVTAVVDGDSLWVRPAAGGAPREIRLRGIDAPEICQPHGKSARDALAAHVLHRRVAVASRARDSYRRVLAQVSVEGRDAGAWMVAQGHAWSHRFQRDRGPYAAQETRARHARLGLWAGGAAMDPREFRKRHGSCR